MGGIPQSRLPKKPMSPPVHKRHRELLLPIAGGKGNLQKCVLEHSSPDLTLSFDLTHTSWFYVGTTFIESLPKTLPSSSAISDY